MVPNPVIHSLQILDDARDVRRVEVVESVSLKRGQRMGFSRARIVDAEDHARVIALVEAQGASIGDVPPGLQRFDDQGVLPIVDSPDLPPLWQVFGASRRDDGHWVLPELRAELASPDAALHLGPQHILLERAAVDLAEGRSGQRIDCRSTARTSCLLAPAGKIGTRSGRRASPSGGADGSGRIGVR